MLERYGISHSFSQQFFVPCISSSQLVEKVKQVEYTFMRYVNKLITTLQNKHTNLQYNVQEGTNTAVLLKECVLTHIEDILWHNFFYSLTHTHAPSQMRQHLPQNPCYQQSSMSCYITGYTFDMTTRTVKFSAHLCIILSCWAAILLSLA